jgi:hypothetical protein
MKKLPTIEQVEEELAELERKMAGYEEVLRRRNLLLKFKQLADQIASGTGETEKQSLNTTREDHSDQPSSVANSARRARNKTADLAEQVLSGAPSMHINELLRMMRESGWIGSGNDRKDRKAIVTALQNQPKRFAKVGDGTWTVRAHRGHPT